MRKYVFNQYSISSFLSNKLIISSNNVGIFQLNPKKGGGGHIVPPLALLRYS